MNSRLWLVTALALVLVASSAAKADGKYFGQLQVNANLSPAAWPIDPFILVDHRGAAFTQDNLKGRWTFVVFGHTHCADPCAVAMSALERVSTILARAQVARSTQILFISLDAKRDTTARLREYLSRFDSGFIGASGSPSTINQLVEQMSDSPRPSGLSPGSDEVEGNTAIKLIGSDSLLRAEFFPPFDAKALTAVYLRMRFSTR
jgi:protein SCO1